MVVALEVGVIFSENKVAVGSTITGVCGCRGVECAVVERWWFNRWKADVGRGCLAG